MPGLSELELRHAYHKGADDIARDFYLPCMERAVAYDRAVGFFSSTVYIIAWPALKAFVGRGGRMRVVTSPSLSPEDASAIQYGYHARSEEDVARVLQQIHQLLDLPRLNKPTRVLATLVAMGVLDVRIAFLGESAEARLGRFFHDKVGIFKDTFGNSVVFRGSMNESWLGLANDGNLESVDVYVSWAGERERSRVAAEISYFESLWSDKYPTVKVVPFPDAVRSFLVTVAETERWPELVDEIVEEAETYRKARLRFDVSVGGQMLRPHQLEALQAWTERGRRGILEHATGSGKTITAIAAMRDALDRGEIPLVVVPSQILLEQWGREIRRVLGPSASTVLRCGAGDSRWRSEGLLRLWTRPTPSTRPRVVLATAQTASKSEFLSQIHSGDHLFLIADEVHTLGSPQYRRILSLETGPRLGLSATPQRFGDPDGTKVLMDYFGGMVPPPYTLRDGIRDGILTPYWYWPHPVYLSEDEQIRWEELSEQVRHLYAKIQAESVVERAGPLEERMRLLLIERARIAKTAANKVNLAVNVIERNYESGQRWIVYCDSLEQLRKVRSALRQAGYSCLEYHTGMRGDCIQTLRLFEREGGIIIAIRCLDEGVDVPAATHALILASSRNPRQFIQRRGRVLRKAPDKTLAYIHDAIVLPRKPPEPEQTQIGHPLWSLLEGEIARAIEFSRYAVNPGGVTELRRIAIKYDLDSERLSMEGVEE